MITVATQPGMLPRGQAEAAADREAWIPPHGGPLAGIFGAAANETGRARAPAAFLIFGMHRSGSPAARQVIRRAGLTSEIERVQVYSR